MHALCCSYNANCGRPAQLECGNMKTITPTLWFDGNVEDAAERATKAMLAMDKIEIDSLEEAFNGD
jgi:hypothetical protein